MEKTEIAEVKAPTVTKKPLSETAKPVYTVAQLVDGYKVFGTTRAIVECALKLSGKDSFTIDEAKIVINNFKNKR